ncbi:MAG: type II toxin-antitoxin system HicB family antitoxin [Rhodoferax sp.]|jgi:antitoxin HicB|nr:type II toxin-antitoxin system HicB family antitoxin [Rhodoferax sp.]
MNLAYPVTLTTYANGQVGASFCDVPEAHTAGNTEAQTLDRAQDALVVALSCYLDNGRPLPTPSKAKRGQRLVMAPPRAAIKLAIYQAMRDQSMSQAQLAERIGVDGKQVRRILNLDHESKLSQLESALAALGLVASVEISSAN